MSTNLEFDGDCSVLPVWRPEGVFKGIAAFKLILHQRRSFCRQTLSASREKSDVVRRAVARRQRRRQRLRFRP